MSAFEVAQARGLGNAATRLVVWIALNVDDRKTPAVYFGGASHRAMGMRAGISDRSVRECMAEIKAAGMLVEMVNAKPGRNASYQLMFSPKKWRKDNLPHSEDMAEVEPPNGGGTASGMAEVQPPPERDLSPIEGGTPSRYCRLHPRGTEKACYACKTAREAYEQRPRKVRQFVAHAEDMCADGNHKWMPDGTCNFCTQRKIAKNDEWMYR